MRFKGFGSIGKEDGWEREGSEPYKWIVSCKRIEKEKGAAAVGTWGRRRRGRMTTMVDSTRRKRAHSVREAASAAAAPPSLAAESEERMGSARPILAARQHTGRVTRGSSLTSSQMIGDLSLGCPPSLSGRGRVTLLRRVSLIAGKMKGQSSLPSSPRTGPAFTLGPALGLPS